MRRASVIAALLAAVVVLAMAAGCSAQHGVDAADGTSDAVVDGGAPFARSVEGYNSVEVEKQGTTLVITAQSEAAFFDGAQFTVDVDEETTPEDVEIVWMTLGGSTEASEGNDRIIAEIKVTNGGKQIFDQKVNFAKRAVDAVEDVLDRSGA